MFAPPRAELACLRLVLNPEGATTFKYEPVQAVHAALHRALEGFDRTLARRVHDEQEKPLTLTPLYKDGAGDPVGSSVAAGERVWIRAALLRPDVAAAVPEALPRWRQAHGPLILEHRRFHLDEFELVGPSESTPVSMVMTYAALYEQAEPVAEVTLRFRSPTFFRNKDASRVMRDAPERTLRPDLVFGSYLRRWETFAPEPLPGVTQDLLHGAIRLSDARVSTQVVPFRGRDELTLTGWARFAVAGDGVFRKGIAALADFAAYCGTGARTAFGRGQTERVR